MDELVKQYVRKSKYSINSPSNPRLLFQPVSSAVLVRAFSEWLVGGCGNNETWTPEKFRFVKSIEEFRVSVLITRNPSSRSVVAEITHMISIESLHMSEIHPNTRSHKDRRGIIFDIMGARTTSELTHACQKFSEDRSICIVGES